MASSPHYSSDNPEDVSNAIDLSEDELPTQESMVSGEELQDEIYYDEIIVPEDEDE